jgi:hypothetical protein
MPRPKQAQQVMLGALLKKTPVRGGNKSATLDTRLPIPACNRAKPLFFDFRVTVQPPAVVEPTRRQN